VPDEDKRAYWNFRFITASCSVFVACSRLFAVLALPFTALGICDERGELSHSEGRENTLGTGASARMEPGSAGSLEEGPHGKGHAQRVPQGREGISAPV